MGLGQYMLMLITVKSSMLTSYNYASLWQCLVECRGQNSAGVPVPDGWSAILYPAHKRLLRLQCVASLQESVIL